MENRSRKCFWHGLHYYRQCLAFVLALICLPPEFGWAGPRFAEKKPPTRPEAATAENARAGGPDKIAYVRLWKTASSSGHAIRVKLEPTTKNGPSPQLGPVESGSTFENYAQVPAGHFFCKATDTVASKPQDAPLARLDLNLRTGSYGTVLLREGADNHWHAEYIDDGTVDDSPRTGQITVRNLIPGLGNVTLKVGDSLNVSFSSPECYLKMCGLDLGPAQISTRGKLANGQAFEWTSGANFSGSRKITLLLLPDPYGRVRPRLYVDGPDLAPVESPTSEPAKKVGN